MVAICVFRSEVSLDVFWFRFRLRRIDMAFTFPAAYVVYARVEIPYLPLALRSLCMMTRCYAMDCTHPRLSLPSVCMRCHCPIFQPRAWQSAVMLCQHAPTSFPQASTGVLGFTPHICATELITLGSLLPPPPRIGHHLPPSTVRTTFSDTLLR